MSSSPSVRNGSQVYANAAAPGLFHQTTPSGEAISTTKRQKYLSVKWLEENGNWPGEANRTIEEFMKEHNFLNYRKAIPNSEAHFEAITDKLRALFDRSEWNAKKHEPMLQEKIKNKIHRIRQKILDEKSNKLQIFQDAFRQLDPAEHESAMRFVVTAVGQQSAQQWVGDACQYVQPAELGLQSTLWEYISY